jgi:hypothetical protein
MAKSYTSKTLKDEEGNYKELYKGEKIKEISIGAT